MIHVHRVAGRRKGSRSFRVCTTRMGKKGEMLKTRTGPRVFSTWQETVRARLMLVTIFSLLVSVNAAYAQNLLRSPQKIVIDQARDRLLVSNFDGGGSLVQIDADGNQDYFVVGAGCIDGLDIADDVVYCVANNRRLFGYDLESGQRKGARWDE
jgi:hypothetical protein